LRKKKTCSQRFHKGAPGGENYLTHATNHGSALLQGRGGGKDRHSKRRVLKRPTDAHGKKADASYEGTGGVQNPEPLSKEGGKTFEESQGMPFERQTKKNDRGIRTNALKSKKGKETGPAGRRGKRPSHGGSKFDVLQSHE